MEAVKKNADCPCQSGCARQGDCEACQAYHRKAGSKTSCGK